MKMQNTVTRRDFIKASALAGGGLMLSFHALGSIEKSLTGTIEAESFAPNAFLKISSDGVVTLLAPNPEVGQGVKTSLPLLVAEELDVNWNTVVVEQAGLDTMNYQRQVAGGSGSVRSSWKSFREAGAAARYMLVAAAADQWEVSASTCKTENGYVVHSSGKKLSYGELAAKAATLEVPKDVPTKDAKDFKLFGQRIRNVDNKGIVTGKVGFGIDTRRAGMLYAMVARPPAFGKKIKSIDDSKAKQVNGVKQVIRFDDKVAVLATSTWNAKKGRDALTIQWEDDGKLENTADHQAAFKKLVMDKTAAPKRNDGDVDKGLAEGSKVLESLFEAPFLPHAAMEPMNFFADVREDKVEMYGPTQTPARTRTNVAKLLNISEDKITVGMSRMGGGFGRRLQADYSEEAAMISNLAKAPVQVIWTREDDMQGGFYRPTGMYRYRAALDKEGQLTTWHLSAAAVNSGNASRENNFPAGAVPNFRIDSHNLESKITVGPWRAPNHNFIAFTEESFIDEIAHELKKDPVAYRLDLLEKAKSNPVGNVAYDIDRYANVVKLAAEMGEWGKTDENGIHKGFGAHFSFGTYVAQVAEISIQGGKVKVHRVHCAVDCGRVINLSGAETQIEGGIIDGLGHALFGELTFKEGAAEQRNFDTYKLIRMADAPEISVTFVKSEVDPMGLGEPGLPPIAAAVGNAIFAATGKRIRKLPFSLNEEVRF